MTAGGVAALRREGTCHLVKMFVHLAGRGETSAGARHRTKTKPMQAPPHALPTPFAGWTRRLLVSMLLPLAALTLSGCATTDGTEAPDATVHGALDAAARRHHVCAAAIAVVRHGRLASTDAASGCSPAAAVTADSVFQAASLGKPVFAYAVLKLARQGHIDLDAPVMTYLPQGYRHRFDPLRAEPVDVVTDPRLQAVTVRMLLNHTSGLPNWASGPLTFEASPGTAWHYSGEGYLLLQRAVEAVTGQSLDEFMAAQVFGPLAMHDSSYVRNGRTTRDPVAGTKANGAPRATMALTTPVAAFTLHTTAADYGRFLAALLDDEAVLKAVTAAPVEADRALGLGWGPGWGVEDDAGERYLWQWGNNPGYRGFAIASPGTKDGLVLLTASENGLALAEPVARKVMGGEHRLFRSPVLGTDVLTVLCNTVWLCL